MSKNSNTLKCTNPYCNMRFDKKEFGRGRPIPDFVDAIKLQTAIAETPSLADNRFPFATPKCCTNCSRPNMITKWKDFAST